MILRYASVAFPGSRFARYADPSTAYAPVSFGRFATNVSRSSMAGRTAPDWTFSSASLSTNRAASR